MMDRIRAYITKLRAQAQLARARRGRADTRQRAIQWLNRRHAPAQSPKHGAEGAPAEQTPAPGGAPLFRQRRRGQQSGDTLAELLRTDTESQLHAEQLWWKFTQWYLPAKCLDIQTRRGMARAEDEHEDA